MVRSGDASSERPSENLTPQLPGQRLVDDRCVSVAGSQAPPRDDLQTECFDEVVLRLQTPDIDRVCRSSGPGHIDRENPNPGSAASPLALTTPGIRPTVSTSRVMRLM